MHAHADGVHFGLSPAQMPFVDLPDQGVGADRRHGHHKQDSSQFLSALLAHLKTAAAVSADFKGRVHAVKRSDLFGAGKAFDVLDFEHNPDGRRLTDALEGL